MTGTDSPATASLLYSATVSLDGFIAGPRGDRSWMTPYLGPNPVAGELMGDIGALLAGVRSFGGDDPIRAAKAAAGANEYVNHLGVSVGRQCLEAGVPDEILVLIAPVMLGDGTGLFEHPGGSTIALERISLSHAPLATNLWFRVKQ